MQTTEGVSSASPSAHDAVDWNAALSLGEQQQLALGRVLLARPDFAVLDEATSAIEDGVELLLFEKLQQRGITLVTVTHRASLREFHSNILRIKGGKGRGERSWTLKPIEAEEAAGLGGGGDTSSESDFASPMTSRTSSSLRRSRSRSASNKNQDDKDKDEDGGEDKDEDARVAKPMPQMSDARRTMMLVRLILPKLTLADESILKLAAYSALISVSVWINTGFLSSIPGVLQALAIESNVNGYVRFQLKVFGVRLASMLISTTQTWLRSETSTIWRGRLSKAVTDRYVANHNFFVMKHIDRRIVDADTRITQEITQAVQEMNMMVMKILRPVFDAVYCTFLLVRVQLPFAGVVAMWSYGIISVLTIKLLQPDFADLVTEQERTMAEFRSAHDRVSGAAESIAFSDGGHLEETIVNEANAQVLRLQHRTNNQQAAWSVVSRFVMGKGGGGGGRGGGKKGGGGGGGGGGRGGGGGGGGGNMNLQSLITQVLRFFWSTGQGTDGQVLSNRGGTQMAATSQFIGSLIDQSFGTFSTLLGLNESFQQLFGTCRRVSDVLLVIEEIERERADDAKRVADTVQEHTPRRGERIGLVDATVVAPDGMVVARDLSFSVEVRSQSVPPPLLPLATGAAAAADGAAAAAAAAAGDATTESRRYSTNLLISGGSGCGKSTIVRVISGLWSTGLQSGGVNRPNHQHLAIVPQQPLVPTTPLSLLDMLTYPVELEQGSAEEQQATESLSMLMKRLRVYYIVERNSSGSDSGSSGWHGRQQWETYLSMGEGQCIGLLRALYHRPRFAVLDEATSAMSTEIAHEAYTLLVSTVLYCTARCH
jgi:ATP-binding cassette subfamily D (ALD) long-chain fatty acid import protein